MSQFNKIASTRKDCSECLSLVLLSATTLLKIESLFNEIDAAFIGGRFLHHQN
jgi:hypothetical protein